MSEFANRISVIFKEVLLLTKFFFWFVEFEKILSIEKMFFDIKEVDAFFFLIKTIFRITTSSKCDFLIFFKDLLSKTILFQ